MSANAMLPVKALALFLFVSLIVSEGKGAAFILTGSMSTGRISHTATLLSNGKVLVTGGGSALATTELYDSTAAGWAVTGSLNTARKYQTATLLNNGKVLVTGGLDASSNYLATAELYDPATGTWTATATMSIARDFHTATLLTDGKVLVVGGENGGLSAEIYDSAAATWTATGAMNSPHSHHTATLLAGGKVMIAGGNGGGTGAELYDPASGSWTVTGSMGVPRTNHTATLLTNGLVLVAGGGSTAELYNPVTELWTATGSLNTNRNSHSATLLPSGKVIAVGGYSISPSGASTVLNTAELYDPVTGVWTPTVSLNAVRFGQTATMLANGRILLSGGSTGFNPLPSAELYESAVGNWAISGSLNSLVYEGNPACMLPDGKVLVASGEVYDPSSGTWTTTGSMQTGRSWSTATLLPNGKVLVVGGLDPGSRQSIADCELYDPVTGTWSVTGSLNIARYGQRPTLLQNGKLLVSGGYNGSYPSGGFVAAGEIYDPATGLWTMTGSVSIARDGHTATLLTNGLVLITGGTRFINGGYTEVVNCDLYNPATGSWTATGSLTSRRSSHTATLLPNGRVMVTGGHFYQSGVFYRNNTEIYTPATGTWALTGSMINTRDHHTATLLPNGKVLVAGGTQHFNGAAMANCELFDPAVGTWSATASMGSAREYHSALLLPSGNVLAVAGTPDAGYTYWASTELYDVGLGFDPARTPQISTITSPLVSGGRAAFTGAGYRGISGGSTGTSQDSPADYPVLQLRNVDNEQIRFLPLTNWSASSGISGPVPSMPPGWTMATVFVNGIPGNSALLPFKLSAPVVLGNLLQTYNGSARSVSVATSPSGLDVSVTYNGSPDAPTNVGSYSVVATVNSTIYQGGASNTLLIARQLTAGTASYSRARDIALRIKISDLLTNVTSFPADNPPLTLVATGPSGQGATLTTNSSYILYSPANNNNDAFTYQVSDGAGASATGSVVVTVASTSGPPLPSSSISLSGGTATIAALGIPGYTYVLQTTTNLSGPWWPIGTNTASVADGSLLFSDPNATNAQQYYRTAQP
jgi:N-acetylneuraminic acid mutarotase